jgi:hypothetical protein
MQKWVLGEAACLQRDAMSPPTFAVFVGYGYPLTRESYLNINNVDENDLDAEQESELTHLLQDSMMSSGSRRCCSRSRLTTPCDGCPRVYSDAGCGSGLARVTRASVVALVVFGHCRLAKPIRRQYQEQRHLPGLQFKRQDRAKSTQISAADRFIPVCSKTR